MLSGDIPALCFYSLVMYMNDFFLGLIALVDHNCQSFVICQSTVPFCLGCLANQLVCSHQNLRASSELFPPRSHSFFTNPATITKDMLWFLNSWERNFTWSLLTALSCLLAAESNWIFIYSIVTDNFYTFNCNRHELESVRLATSKSTEDAISIATRKFYHMLRRHCRINLNN